MVEYPEPVSKRCTQEILRQMDTIFYKIKENIGFFCKIKYKNENIQALIINKYINDEDIKSYNTLINKENIELDKIIYKSIEFNISLIKIKDNRYNFNFIEIDDKFYENDSEIYYDKESIYILQCDNIKNILVSYGMVKGINKEKLKYTGNINSKFSLIFICPIIN